MKTKLILYPTKKIIKTDKIIFLTILSDKILNPNY